MFKEEEIEKREGNVRKRGRRRGGFSFWGERIRDGEERERR
jgi:hypothetical protein